VTGPCWRGLNRSDRRSSYQVWGPAPLKITPGLRVGIGGQGVEGYGIAELSERLCELLCTPLPGLWSGFLASFDVPDLLMENLPDQPSQTMGDGPDGSFIFDSGQETAEQRLKDGAFLLSRRPEQPASEACGRNDSLLENASRGFLPR
jgi:hypothetical protein